MKDHRLQHFGVVSTRSYGAARTVFGQVQRVLCAVLLVAGALSVQSFASIADSLRWPFEQPQEQLVIPLAAADVTLPEDLKSAIKDYNRGNYRLCTEKVSKYCQLDLPDESLDAAFIMLGESYRALHIDRKAAQCYTFVLQRFSNGSYVAPSLFRLMQQAYSAGEEHRADSLAAVFTTRFSTHPLYLPALYVQGVSLYERGKYAEAQALLAHIDESSSQHWQAQLLTALCLTQIRQPEKAQEVLEYLRTNCPDKRLTAEAALIMGDIYAQRKQPADALLCYLSVPGSTNRKQYAQVRIARLYFDQGELKRARSIAAKYLKRKKDKPYFLEMASLLESVYLQQNDQAHAEQMSAAIFSHIQNALLTYAVYDEIARTDSLIREWKLLGQMAQVSGNAELDKQSIFQIGKLTTLNNRFAQLGTGLSGEPVKPGVQQGSPVYTQRYLALTRPRVEQLLDSVTLLGTLVRSLDASRPDSLRDSLFLSKLDSAQTGLRQLKVRSDDIADEYHQVLDDIKGQTDLRLASAEEQQVKFLDWAFLHYQKLKEQAGALNGALREAQKADTTQQHNDSLATTLSLRLKRLETNVRSFRIWAKQYMEKFVALAPYTRYAPQLFLRLAELHYDQAADNMNIAMATYEARLEQGAADSTDFPQYDLDSMILMYDRIISAWPSNPAAPAAWFYKAKALQKSGNMPDANSMFETLVAEYPESEYFVEANMNIGSYYFLHPKADSGRGYKRAEEAYNRVLQFKEHPQYVQALYQLGWCYYMQDQYDLAISVFKYLIDQGKLDFNPVGMEERRIANPLLRDEAIDYIAISFDEDKSLDEAVIYLRSVGNDDYAAMVLRRMGELREEDLDYPKAAIVYERLLQEFPASIAAPQVSVNLIKVYELAGRVGLAVERRSNFASSYGRSSPWHAAIKAKDSTLLPHVDSLCIAMGMFVADAAFRTAESRKDTTEYARAATLYGVVASQYPQHPAATEAQWNVAVILDEKLGKHNEAYKRYLDFAANAAADTTRRAQAALNAIALIQRQMPTDTSGAGGTLDNNAVELLSACNVYLDNFPNGPEAVAVRLTEGSVYFNRKMYSDAVGIYEIVARESTSPEKSLQARFLLGQCYFETEIYDSSAASFTIVYKAATDAAQKKESFRFLLQSRYLGAKKMVDSLKFEQAALAFTALEKDFPGNEVGDAALFNAAGAYESMQQWEKAADVYAWLSRQYATSKYAPDALFNAAVDFEKADKYEKAATIYESVMSRYEKTPRAKDALFNLGLCYEKLGNAEKMAAVNEQYSRLYPQEKDAEAIMIRSARYYIKAKMWQKADDIWANYIKRFPDHPVAIEALCMRGRIAVEKNDEKGALAFYSQAELLNTRQLMQQKENNPYFAAEAAMRTGDIKHRQFTEVALVLPEKKLAEGKKLKSQLLIESVTAYQRVITYGGEQLFAASLCMGQLYEEMALSWATQPRAERDKFKVVVLEKTISEESAVLLQKAFVPYVNALKGAAGLDSLTADQKASIESIKKSLLTDVSDVGSQMLRAVRVFIEAPIPTEIAQNPVALFQYQVQLLGATQQPKQKAAEYYVSSIGLLKGLSLSPEQQKFFATEAARINFQVANDFDQLQQTILTKTGDLGPTMTEAEKEDVIFQLEDIVSELQDKAITAYVQAMTYANTADIKDDRYYPLIIKSLARLAPEQYGKQYFAAVTVESDNDWASRTDSTTAWNTLEPPLQGWKPAGLLGTVPDPSFTGSKARLIWDNAKNSTSVFLYRHVFFPGDVRDAKIYITANVPYTLFLNGSKLKFDTALATTGLIRDSIVDISKLFRGGDNVLALFARAPDSLHRGVALSCATLLDTSQHFTSTAKAPRFEPVAVALGAFVQPTPAVAATPVVTQQKPPLVQPSAQTPADTTAPKVAQADKKPAAAVAKSALAVDSLKKSTASAVADSIALSKTVAQKSGGEKKPDSTQKSVATAQGSNAKDTTKIAAAPGAKPLPSDSTAKGKGKQPVVPTVLDSLKKVAAASQEAKKTDTLPNASAPAAKKQVNSPVVVVPKKADSSKTTAQVVSVPSPDTPKKPAPQPKPAPVAQPQKTAAAPRPAGEQPVRTMQEYQVALATMGARKQAATEGLRRERLEVQKIHIRQQNLDAQIGRIKAEIAQLKAAAPAAVAPKKR